MEIRRVFPSWSLSVSPSFDERHVDDGNGYWHAWDDDRSVSLTSMWINDEHGQPVPAAELARTMQPLVEGDPVSELPHGLVGWAIAAPAPQPARASRMLQGVLAVNGRVLLVTITGDDPAWAREVWLSIRHHKTGGI